MNERIVSRRRISRIQPRRSIVGIVVLLVLAFAAPSGGAVSPYAESLTPAYQVDSLLSVGDRVPLTNDPSRSFQMVGIPDGLGAHPNPGGGATLYMNHELRSSVKSEPVAGAPLTRGAFVSKYLLDPVGVPVSGRLAYDSVFVEDALVGPAANPANATRAFSRLCSGALGGSEEGFDRPIYFAGEESGASETFDPKGGSAVAMYDGEAHVLPGFGHLPYENIVPQAHPGNRTVVMVLEDGPSSPDSQLFMYVGKKDHRPGATVLERNGLVGGSLYTFASNDAALNSEVTLQQGTISGRWVEIPGAAAMNEVQLEAAADAAGAFGFIRTEDGAFNKRKGNEFFFVTTGGATGNRLGRLYSLQLHPGNPVLDATLTVAYNGDAVIAAGGDTAISPDNIDTSAGYLMINEDGTADTRPVMAAKGRDGSIWRFDLVQGGTGSLGVDPGSASRVVELNPPGRDGKPVGPGIWETSGIVDSSSMFGEGSWLFDVQAHPPTAAPAPNTVEDGQLLIMRSS